MHAIAPTSVCISATAVRRIVSILGIIVATLCLEAATASADCNVERRQAAGNYFRVVKCDESQQAIDDAIDRAVRICTDSTQRSEKSCYDEVAESHRLRKEAMLRRTLKDGASIEAAAQLYGYTEEEVRRWVAENMPMNRGYAESNEIAEAVLKAEQDLAKIRAMAEREAASR